MHILALLAAIVTFAAVWAWRIRAAREGAREASKVIEAVANAPRRLTFKYKMGKDGLALIDDPREAAAVMLVAVARAAGAALTQRQEDVIAENVRRTFSFSADEASDLIAHAVFVNNTSPDAQHVMRKMSDCLINAPHLGPREVVDFDSMQVAVSEAEGTPTRAQLELMQIFRSKAGLKT